MPKVSFIKNTGLSVAETRWLLAFKMLTGLACAYFFDQVFTTADYVGYNMDGKVQYELLLSNPVLFFTDFARDIDAYGLGGMFNSSYSFWAYLRFNLLFKFIAILDLITRGNFYLNSVIFSSLVFFGHMAFFRIYNDIYPGNKSKILACCFLIPSLLLYTSCAHKDGVVFLAIGIVSLVFHLFLKDRKHMSFKVCFVFLLGITTIFLFRNYVLVALLPAMLTAYLCKVLAYKKRWIILGSYFLFGVFFFSSSYIHPAVSLPGAVIKRKADFALLGKARTNIPMNELLPTAGSFANNLPQAINHSLFRPYLWEFRGTEVLLTALELLFYQVLVLMVLFVRSKRQGILHDFNVYGFLFFLNMILIIGYTIPNVGAIVRYRSLFWIFLLCPVICNTRWTAFRLSKKEIAS